MRPVLLPASAPASNTGVISPNTPAQASPLGVPGGADPTADDLRRGRALVVGLHWLTATTQVNELDVIGFVCDYLAHGPEVRHSGQMGYTTTYTWAGGLRLMSNERRPDMGVCLLADGDACEYYGWDKLSYIYQALQFRASRVDLAADGCRFTPSALRRLWLADQVRTVARVARDSLPGRSVRSHRWYSSPSGDTLYMGSRTSTQFARCYNARGFTRFELELKKDRAQQVMGRLCDGADMAHVLGASLHQFVAFVALDDEKRERCTVLPFWQRFTSALGSDGAVTRLAGRPERTAERLIDWIETQVAPSLVVYEILRGGRDNYDDVRRNLRRIGLERAKPRHHALIAAGGGWLSDHELPSGVVYQPAPELRPSLYEQNLPIYEARLARARIDS